ncbi:MAG: FlgD immunoglobulin-like domain containing protein, partial [Fidelibacterota bacterium]
GTMYHMWYSGGDLLTKRIGYATSPDGVAWTKDTLNPILDVGPSGSWDDYYVGHCSVVFDTATSTYKMWYTGGDGALPNANSAIGYAESPLEPSVEIVVEKGMLAVLFTLRQNHPNPFNPVTALRYDLPERSEVTITIYDILGRQVKTLVHGMEEPGHKTVMWDGTNHLGQQVSAGVYLYAIQAGGFTQTRKMILLR